MSETEVKPNPWLQIAGIFENDEHFDEWQQAIRDYRHSRDFMEEHDAVPLEIPARTTEIETGCRAETMGVFAEAETRTEALRRLQAWLFQLFLDGALIAAPDGSDAQ